MSNDDAEVVSSDEGSGSARLPHGEEGARAEIPIYDVRIGEKLIKMVSDVSDQLFLVSGTLLEVERAVSSSKPSTTQDEILSQLLTISRETLVKVSAPNKSGTELMEPLLRDVVGLVFNIDKLLQVGDNSALQVFRDAVVDVAERYGIEFYAPEVGEEFVPSQANAVRTEQVGRKELAGRVTAVLRVGCRLKEKLLFYPQVSVSRFSPEPVSVS